MEMGLLIQDQPAAQAYNVMVLIASNLEVSQVCAKLKSWLSPFSTDVTKMLFKRASLFLLVGCIQAGQVCGNGTAYQNSICCSGLQCDGSHCTSSQGGGKIYS